MEYIPGRQRLFQEVYLPFLFTEKALLCRYPDTQPNQLLTWQKEEKNVKRENDEEGWKRLDVVIEFQRRREKASSDKRICHRRGPFRDHQIGCRVDCSISANEKGVLLSSELV